MPTRPTTPTSLTTNSEAIETTMRTIAVDWSGMAVRADKKIWVAEAVQGELVFLENGRSREGVAQLLIEWAETDGRLVVGFDFAFSFPAWFLNQKGCDSARELWSLVAMRGEGWLAACQPPFWGRPNKRRPPDIEGQDPFRATDRQVKPVAGTMPKSVFQIGGAGAVGTASIRGMPILERLSAARFSIWPFDPPGWPRAIEIYPRILTGSVRKSSQRDREDYMSKRFGNGPLVARAASSEDAFDAAVSALVMSEHSAELAQLHDLSSEASRLEGAIWSPTSVAPARRDFGSMSSQIGGIREGSARWTWSALSAQRLGRYGERLAHLEFSAHGFDVYVPDVDDRSVDFVVRSATRQFTEVQVKSIRNHGYVFMRKRLFQPHESLYVVLLVFADGRQPDMYLIPSEIWLEVPLRRGFSSRDYGPGHKSEPEWGLDITAKTLAALEEFRFDRVAPRLAR